MIMSFTQEYIRNNRSKNKRPNLGLYFITFFESGSFFVEIYFLFQLDAP